MARLIKMSIVPSTAPYYERVSSYLTQYMSYCVLYKNIIGAIWDRLTLYINYVIYTIRWRR